MFCLDICPIILLQDLVHFIWYNLNVSEYVHQGPIAVISALKDILLCFFLGTLQGVLLRVLLNILLSILTNGFLDVILGALIVDLNLLHSAFIVTFRLPL